MRGEIEFSKAFEMDIETVADGFEIPEMISLIESYGDQGFAALESWCANTLDWFDQYKTMRIIAALISWIRP